MRRAACGRKVFAARVEDQPKRRGRSAVCGQRKSGFRCERGERSGPGPQTPDLLCPFPYLSGSLPCEAVRSGGGLGRGQPEV